MSKNDSIFMPLWVLLISISFSGMALGKRIFSCADSMGKVYFTDDIRNCESSNKEEKNEFEIVKLRSSNTHSLYGETVSEEYHNYAFRAYEDVPGYSIRVVAEKKLVSEHPELLGNAAEKLEKAVAKAISSFPEHVRHEFDGVKYYLFSGEESRTGGRKGGQWYFRKGNTTSARFDDSVVIRSAKDYLTFYSADRAALTAAHELSHAYYYYHKDRIYRAVLKAFRNAKNQKLYQNVKHQRGGLVKEGYAVRDHREYFAELSKIFNIGNYYFPFNALELREYDPIGYQVVRDAYFFKL